MSSIVHFLNVELKKWLIVIRDLELMPHFKDQDWSSVWLQKFKGDITISVTTYIKKNSIIIV